MAIILLFVCFFAVFLITGINSKGISKHETLLRGVLVFSLLLVIVTEVLGFFKLISFQSLCICWLMMSLASLLYLHLNKDRAGLFMQRLSDETRQLYRGFSFFERFLLIALAILFLLEFVQGIIYPPNNLDSMTYHMARVVSWVSHHSVSPYPTHIVRQLYQPPFAEYVILNFNLLSEGDYFSALVQFLFQLFCIVAIIGIVKQAGLKRNYQIMAMVLATTIPEVVLQSTSTQNDIVASFFLLSSFYFCLRCVKGANIGNYLFLGLSVGLAVFTKGTAYMLLAPVAIIFGIHVLMKIFQGQYKFLLFAILLVGLVPLLINTPQYCRNYYSSGNLLGIDKSEWGLYRNEQMSPKLFFCNTAKDIDLNMGLLCVPRITYGAGFMVHKLFDHAGVNIDDPAITFPHTTFINGSLKGVPGDADYYHGMLVATHEDYGANFMHLVLIWISLAMIIWYFFKNERNTLMLLLMAAVSVQVIIFCGYLKFQPWGTRLQTGIFLLSVPLICYAASVNKLFEKVMQKVVLSFILFYAFIIVTFNYSRPLVTYTKQVHAYTVTSPISVFSGRFIKLFAASSLKSFTEYSAVNDGIKSSHYKNIGLITDDSGWEYPLFIDCYKRELNPIHINVRNYTGGIRGYNDNVDCIVSTNTNTAFIDYKGERFYNQNIKNTVVWYYKLNR